MSISTESFISSVTQRARLAFMLTLGEKTIDILQDKPHVFKLARNLLDTSWLWEESLSISPFEILEYLESSSEDFHERETLSLVCYFDNTTPRPILSDVEGGLIPDIIAKFEEEEAIPGTVSLIVESQLISKSWVERAISFLMSNYRSSDPNTLGEPIKREELMGLA
jgi:hypothetical protein